MVCHCVHSERHKIAQNVSLHARARENAAADENFLKFHFPQSAANLSEWPSPAEVCAAISASCAAAQSTKRLLSHLGPSLDTIKCVSQCETAARNQRKNYRYKSK